MCAARNHTHAQHQQRRLIGLCLFRIGVKQQTSRWISSLFGCRPMCAMPHMWPPPRARLLFGCCQREPCQRLWLPPLRWLLFGSCKSCGCHCYFLRKTAPQPWRQNPSPKVWRCHRCRVASHSQKEKTTAAPHMQWQALAANQTASTSPWHIRSNNLGPPGLVRRGQQQLLQIKISCSVSV